MRRFWIKMMLSVGCKLILIFSHSEYLLKSFYHVSKNARFDLWQHYSVDWCLLCYIYLGLKGSPARAVKPDPAWRAGATTLQGRMYSDFEGRANARVVERHPALIQPGEREGQHYKATAHSSSWMLNQSKWILQGRLNWLSGLLQGNVEHITYLHAQ